MRGTSPNGAFLHRLGSEIDGRYLNFAEAVRGHTYQVANVRTSRDGGLEPTLRRLDAAVTDPTMQLRFSFDLFRGEAPGWLVNETLAWVHFCPWCGQRLPNHPFEA